MCALLIAFDTSMGGCDIYIFNAGVVGEGEAEGSKGGGVFTDG